MNALDCSGTKPKLSPSRELFRVKISLAGQADFHAEWPDHTKLGKLLAQALHHFNIGGAMAEKYVLQYRGGTCRKTQILAELKGRKLAFTLVANRDSGRFGETLFLR